MSTVEGYAQSALKPMMMGMDVLLTTYDQTVLRAWLVLRGIVFDRVHGPTNFYTRDETLAFADLQRDGLEPIDGMYIWLFYYRSRRWVARSNVASISLHVHDPLTPSHKVTVTTAIVGRLGFQIVFGRWPPGRRLELNSLPVLDYAEATNLIWPETSGRVHWPPPGGYLADDTFEPFSDRFIETGFPLEPEHS